MTPTLKTGWVGPSLATFLAFGIGVLSLHYVGAERLDEARQEHVRQAAVAIAKSPASIKEKREAGLDAFIIGDTPEPRKYGYLHRLIYIDHPERAGGRLVPPTDRDDAEAWRRGRRGRASWADGQQVTAVAPMFGGRVAVVRAAGQPVSMLSVWMLGGIGSGLLLALWFIAVRRGWWTPRRAAIAGPSLLAGWLLCMLWLGVRHLEAPLAALGVLGGQGWSLDISAMVTVVLLPLVWSAIHGYIRSGEASPHRLAYTYIAPAIIGLGVLVMLPFLFGVLLAFFRYDGDHFSWVGLQHFVDILASRDYPITHPLSFYFTLGFTILWTGLNVVLHVGIGLGLALLLNRPDLRFKGLYRVLLIIPWAVPSYITALIWKGMFNQQFGLINAVLGKFGVEPIGWFSGFWTAFIANLSTNTWLGFPFMMVVALGALQSIPKDLYEAAEVDGANAWQQFKHITLPLLKPALLPAVIMGTVWTFNMFNIVYLVSGGRPEGSTDILITEAYRWAFERERYGYAAAYSLLIFVVLLGYSLLTQKVGQSAEEGRA